MKPKFKVGQRVRFKINRLTPKRHHGVGVITRVALPLGTLPVTYFVDTYPQGVLFEDELKAR